MTNPPLHPVDVFLLLTDQLTDADQADADQADADQADADQPPAAQRADADQPDAHRVLLALRKGTGYADGQWNLPSGKLEHGEDALSAVIREAHEEIGVQLHPDEPRMVATVHHRAAAGHGRVGLVFAVAYDPARHLEPVNAEPHKCAKIEWFPADRFPSNTDGYTIACVSAVRQGLPFVLNGWPPQ